MASDPKSATLAQPDHSELERLRAFHAAHFPAQELPTSHKDELATTDPRDIDIGEEEDLGYYDDGVRRTLTDEQIRMFRHSEIQRMILARRLQREKEEEDNNKAQRLKNRALNQKRRFDDESTQNGPAVDTLTYDDLPTKESEKSVHAEKKFLWPQLGK